MSNIIIYLDPENNYQEIEWDGSFLVKDNWIKVPDGAEWMTMPHRYFWRDSADSWAFNKEKDLWTQNGGESFEGYMERADASIVWRRAKQPEELPFIDDGSSWDVQVGGSHYKDFKIQPLQFALMNNLDAAQHNVIKYVMRHDKKNGRQDLEKAKHYIDLMIEHYYGDQS